MPAFLFFFFSLSVLLASSPLIVFKSATSKRYLTTLMEGMKHFSEDVQLASAEALRPLLFLRMDLAEVVDSFLPSLLASLRSPDEHVAARRGYALALATLPPAVYRHCYTLASLRMRREADTSEATGRETMISQDDSQLKKQDEGKKKEPGQDQLPSSAEDEKKDPLSGSHPCGEVSEDCPPTSAAQVSKEQSSRRQRQELRDEGGFLFQVLQDEAKSKTPLNDPGLNDAHTRRNALMAYGFALRALLSPSRPFFLGNRLSSLDKDKEEEQEARKEGGGRERDQGCLTLSDSLFWNDIVETLTVCCSDYQSDRRGDVGSWVREVAAEIVCFLLENANNVDAHPRHASSLPSSQHATQQRAEEDKEEEEKKKRTKQDASASKDSSMTRSADSNNTEASFRPCTSASSLSAPSKKPGQSISLWEKLLGLVLRMALENLGRTRSRAAFLLYHMTAPLPSQTSSPSHAGDEKGGNQKTHEGQDRRGQRAEEYQPSSDRGSTKKLKSLPPPFQVSKNACMRVCCSSCHSGAVLRVRASCEPLCL